MKRASRMTTTTLVAWSCRNGVLRSAVQVCAEDGAPGQRCGMIMLHASLRRFMPEAAAGELANAIRITLDGSSADPARVLQMIRWVRRSDHREMTAFFCLIRVYAQMPAIDADVAAHKRS